MSASSMAKVPRSIETYGLSSLESLLAERVRNQPDLLLASNLRPLSRALQGDVGSKGTDELSARDENDPPVERVHPKSNMPRISSLGSIATLHAGNDSHPSSGRVSPSSSAGGSAITGADTPLATPDSVTARMQSDLMRAVAAAAAEAPGSAAASLPSRLGAGLRLLPPDALHSQLHSLPSSNVTPATSWEEVRTRLGEKRRSPTVLPSTDDDVVESPAASMPSLRASLAPTPEPSDALAPCSRSVDPSGGLELRAPQAVTVIDDGSSGRALPRIANLRQGCSDGLLLLSATACVVSRGSCTDAPHSAKRPKLS